MNAGIEPQNAPVLLLSRKGGRERAALMRRGRLEDLLVAPFPDPEPLRRGAVFLARLAQGAASGDALFADLGGGMGGFVPRKEGDLPPIRPGERVLAQVSREGEEGKAPRLSRRLTYGGRFMLFTPQAPGVNVSRKIKDDDERARLSEALADMADAGGFVLRTRAEGADRRDLRADAAMLIDQHAAAMRRAEALSGPGLVLAAPGAAARAAAEWTAAEMWTDNEDLAREFGATLFHRGDLFDAYGADAQLRALAGTRVELSSGWMAIEPTAALIAVDVNSGDATPPRANRAAILDLPRQLRMRGLGGQIVIDLAGTLDANERGRLAQAFKTAFRGEPVDLGGFGPLGLYELTRRRDRPALDMRLAGGRE